MSLRTRLAIALFLTTAIAVVASVLILSAASLRVVEQQYREALLDAAAFLQPEALKWLQLPPSGVDATVDSMTQQMGIRVTLIDLHGNVLADNRRSGLDLAAMENHGSRPEVLAALIGGQGSDVRVSATLGLNSLYIALPINDEGAIIGVMRLAVPLMRMRELEHLRGRYLFLGTFAVLAAALIVSLIIAGWMTRPLRRLEVVSERIAEGDFDVHPVKPSSETVGRLGTAIGRISESVRTAMARAEAGKRLRDVILIALGEGVLAVDANGRIVMANRIARTLIGEFPDGANVRELFRKPEATALLDDMLSHGKKGAVQVEWPGVNPRHIRIRANPIEDSELGLAGLLVLEDVSESVRTQQVRRDFFTNASHELRTPLTSIVGYLESLNDQLPVDSTLRAEYMDVLIRQAARMRRIVDDLLMLSRVESQQWPVEPINYDIVAQVRQIIDSMERQAKVNNQVLHLDAAHELITVHADQEKLHVVLTNLIDNAVKYAGQGAEITVGLIPQNGEIEISVMDDGPGIPEDHLSRIYERFYRVDKSRSNFLGGTGLGLSIVRHILAAHQQGINVRSRPRGGTCFSFRLPAETHSSSEITS